MKRINYQPSSIKTGAMFLAASAILAFSAQGAFAQSNDFFSSTQSSDLRATAASPSAPGFDPCRGGTAGGISGNSASSCTGAGANKPLLDPTILGNTATNTAGLFTILGPGAVTDNMFGIVVRPTQPGRCSAGASIDASTGTIIALDGLNCGDGKFDPATQGQTIPDVGANLTQAMATNVSIDMRSCAAPTPDAVSCAGDPSQHRSRMENGFVWNPTGAAVAIPVNLTGLPTIATAPAAQNCAAGAGGNSKVCGQFFMDETTALGSSTSMTVSQSASWNTSNDPSGGMLGSPVVSWESRIVQSEFVGGGTFDQTLQGQFTYNVTIGSSAFPAASYPSGESFTIRSGGTGTAIETIGN